MDTIVTRFPPSPTGYLHLGGARTALFNWLYARKMKGKFILRIEDTDTDRSTQDAVDVIFDALNWLGIDWDEGPFYQTRRFDLYREYIDRLIETGHAYYCTCTPDEIESMRKHAMATGGKPKYDGRCRTRGLPGTDNAVVRFKTPLTGTTVVHDVIKGGIAFQNAELDDFIILRSNGAPTYNLAVVVDDISMGVNTVIRGDDHVNNTPKQILLFKAFGADLPTFGHVPMVLGSDRTKLSKRHGAMSVTAYRDMGYLPDAMLNFLVRLGWSFGNQEFFTRNELIEKFSLENIGCSAGIFNPEKLLALNADHIKATPVSKLAGLVLPFLHERGCQAQEGIFLEKVVATLQTRSKTLVEMSDAACFYFSDEICYDPEAQKKFLTPEAVASLELLISEIQAIGNFTEKALEDAFVRVMEKTGMKLGKIAQPVRVALTGKTVSPGIFEIIEVLGKEKALARLQRAKNFIQSSKNGKD